MSRIQHSIVTIAFAVVGLLTAGHAFGQFQVDWRTIDGGGAMSIAGGAFTLSGTFGQPDASSFTTPISGGTFTLVGGFWPVAADVCALGDMNLDGARNGMDVQQFINCAVGGGANCGCGDFDGSGGLNAADVNQFVAALLGG